MFACIDAMGRGRDAVAAVAAFFVACAPAQSAAPASRGPTTAARDASAGDVSRLDWLEGHWFGSDDGTETEEHWTSAAGGALLGMHKDVENGRMTSFEFLRIERTGTGTIYFASPRGSAVTPFTLVDAANRRAVFANDAHDFPQRIGYWVDGAGALHARIEGTLHGEAKSKEWTWQRR
jgi:hypothetical protein